MNEPRRMKVSVINSNREEMMSFFGNNNSKFN